MKRTFFLLLFCPLFLSSIAVFGQSGKSVFGISFDVNLESSIDLRKNLSGDQRPPTTHEVFYGLQYRRYLTTDFYLMGNAGHSNLKNTALDAGIVRHIHLVRGLPLSFTVGAGVGVVFLDDNSYVKKRMGTFIPQGGFDFRPPALPLNIFVAYRPKFDLDGFEAVETATVQFGVGFRF